MERFIVASLLLLASAAAVEARMVPGAAAVVDTPRNTSGARVLIGEDACQRTCNQVRFKAVCRGLTKAPGVSTPQQLLLASIRAASEKAADARAKVEAYAARTHPTGPMASILDDCRKGYDDAVQSLEEARQVAEAQGARDQSLNRKASDALTSTGDCDNGFEDFPDVPSPFAAMQKSVFRHVDSVLGIAVAIQEAEAAHPAAAVRAPHLH
ncbi:unnamed protein product [Urochloa decumbens]|uniref:Pectinesterase inhibitor domain-containing protein n=1 Tax=Urochloa decumbens TaxID=240449 RepID=A0ABC9GL84_9POAL